jgi:hypothetical protein
MNAAIKNIRIGDDFFVSFSPTVISLRFEGLPEDVHLSLSFHPDKPLNFHVTRNTSDAGNKPHISIFKIDKGMAEAALKSLSTNMFICLLEPVDISYYQRSHRKGRIKSIKFFSLNDFEKEHKYNAFRKDIGRIFRKASTMKRKGRLRISPSIEKEFTEWAQNPELRNNLAEKFKHLPRKFLQQTDMGLLICPSYKGNVVRINDRFYSFRKETNPIDLANALLGQELTTLLLFKIRISIQRIKTANNYSEVEKANNPVTLVYEDSVIPKAK